MILCDLDTHTLSQPLLSGNFIPLLSRVHEPRRPRTGVAGDNQSQVQIIDAVGVDVGDHPIGAGQHHGLRGTTGRAAVECLVGQIERGEQADGGCSALGLYQQAVNTRPAVQADCDFV